MDGVYFNRGHVDWLKVRLKVQGSGFRVQDLGFRV
jgi:hypothetical protein